MQNTRDLLLDACRLVGGAQGIDVRPGFGDDGDREQHDALEAIARASRMRVRQVLLKGRWWRTDNGPLLAFRAEERAPVALLQTSPNQYTLIDPADGMRVGVSEQIAESLAPVAVQLYRPLPAYPLGGRELLRFCMPAARRDLLALLVLSLLGALLALLPPLAIEYLVQTLIPAGQRSEVVLAGMALAAAAIAAALFEGARNMALLRLEGRIDVQLQAAIWDRLLSLPPAFFRDYQPGDLGNRALSISAMRQTLSTTALNTVLSGVFSLSSIALLFRYDATLALTVLGALMLFALVVGLAGLVLLGYQRRLRTQQGELAGLVLGLVLALAKLRVAGAERRAFQRWTTLFVGQAQLAYRLGRVGNLLRLWYGVFPLLVTLLVYTLAAPGGTPRLPIASFLAFTAALAQVLAAVTSLSSRLLHATSAVPDYERATPILKATPEIDEHGQHPGVLHGAIALKEVSFRYGADGPLILDNISLDIPAGACVALVGPSGSGKSTLLRLLLGFERPTAGQVCYDGHDLRTLDVREVRRQLGVVLQNGGLASDDLLRNIIGSAPLSPDDAWEAARLVGLDGDIAQMPMGMYTLVDEGGNTLSGGQRQRVLLARAMVRRPPIMLLDEATSALDNVGQQLVTESLSRIKATRVIIAHRLSTIMDADRIYVLVGGRLVQQGSYAELIQQEGPFSVLARRQLVS